MSSRTSSSPSPHGTRTFTLLKHTVTFIGIVHSYLHVGHLEQQVTSRGNLKKHHCLNPTFKWHHFTLTLDIFFKLCHLCLNSDKSTSLPINSKISQNYGFQSIVDIICILNLLIIGKIYFKNFSSQIRPVTRFGTKWHYRAGETFFPFFIPTWFLVDTKHIPHYGAYT